MAHFVRYTLPYMKSNDWKPEKEISVYLNCRWADDPPQEDTLLKGTLFTAEEALKFAIMLAEAAIKLLSEDELKALKNDIK